MKCFSLIVLFVIFGLIPLHSQIIWDEQQDVASSSSGSNHPRVVTDAAGNPLIVWFHASRAMFTRWNGTGFETPRLLSPSDMTVAGADWMGPDIAAHGDTVYVVFKETPEDIGKVWCVHSYNAGLSFSDPIQVDFTADSLSRFPTVTTDDDGNPIVGFMKFNTGFSKARWAVTRSEDFGKSFLPDVKASGWSNPTSVVCDCCPGSIVSKGDTVVMLYRDNNSNLRDTWAGFSADGGYSFFGGMNIDQQNWMVNACPASGPDGVILGNTLYSTFMNAASGKSRVYFNNTALVASTVAPASPVTGAMAGLSTQNFPRISGDGNALGVVWKQIVNGREQCAMKFTENIASGLPSTYDTVDIDNINQADIVVHGGKVFVVWDDYSTGTVKFRAGTYADLTAVKEQINSGNFIIYPNPSQISWIMEGEMIKPGLKLEIYDIRGKLMYSHDFRDNIFGSRFEINNASWPGGLYFLQLTIGDKSFTRKLVKF